MRHRSITMTAIWLAVLFVIPLLSIAGRSVQLTLYQIIPLQSIAFSIYFILAGLVCVYLCLLLKAGGKQDIWHLLWLIALSFFLYGDLHFVEKIHVILFGLFGFFSQHIFRLKNALIACVMISFFDELLQYFLVIRVGDWRDVRLNLFSSLLGLFLAFLLLNNRDKKIDPSDVK